MTAFDTYDSYGGLRKNVLNISHFHMFVTVFDET